MVQVINGDQVTPLEFVAIKRQRRQQPIDGVGQVLGMNGAVAGGLSKGVHRFLHPCQRRGPRSFGDEGPHRLVKRRHQSPRQSVRAGDSRRTHCQAALPNPLCHLAQDRRAASTSGAREHDLSGWLLVLDVVEEPHQLGELLGSLQQRPPALRLFDIGEHDLNSWGCRRVHRHAMATP